MFEVFKLLWDVIVLRDQARKGKLTASVWIFAAGFVLVLYLIVLPLLLYYVNHPGCRLALVAAIAFALADAAALVWFYLNRRSKH